MRDGVRSQASRRVHGVWVESQLAGSSDGRAREGQQPRRLLSPPDAAGMGEEGAVRADERADACEHGSERSRASDEAVACGCGYKDPPQYSIARPIYGMCDTEL